MPDGRRAEMKRRIAADLVLIEQQGAQAQQIVDASTGTAAYYGDFAIRAVALGLLGEALDLAAADLDTLFDGGEAVAVASADRFVIRHLSDVAGAANAVAVAGYGAATDAKAAYRKARGLEQGDMPDPEFRTLRGEEFAASAAVGTLQSLQHRIGSSAPDGTRTRKIPGPDTQFAAFAQPIVLAGATHTLTLPEDPLTGPREAFSMAGAARTLYGALRGDARAAQHRRADLRSRGRVRFGRAAMPRARADIAKTIDALDHRARYAPEQGNSALRGRGRALLRCGLRLFPVRVEAQRRPRRARGGRPSAWRRLGRHLCRDQRIWRPAGRAQPGIRGRIMAVDR